MSTARRRDARRVFSGAWEAFRRPAVAVVAGAACATVAIVLSLVFLAQRPLFIVDQVSSASVDAFQELRSGRTLGQTFTPTRPIDRIVVQFLPTASDDPRIAFTVSSVTDGERKLEGRTSRFAVPAPPDDPTIAEMPRLAPGSRWLLFNVDPFPSTAGPLTFSLRLEESPTAALRIPYQPEDSYYPAGRLLVNGDEKTGDLSFRAYRHASRAERLTHALVAENRILHLLEIIIVSLFVAFAVQLMARWNADDPLLPSPPFLLFALLALLFVVPFFASATLWGVEDWTEAMAHYASARQSVAAGQFPLWNPYFCGGTPLWAMPQPYWPSLSFLVTALFGDVLGTKLAIAAGIFIGLWGMERLARTLGIRGPEAIIPAVVFLFGGFLAGHLAVGQMLWLAVAWIPWVIVFFLRSFTRPWRIVPAAFFFLLIVLEGRLHVAAYLTFFLPLFALALVAPRLIPRWRAAANDAHAPTARAVLRSLFLFTVLVAGLGAVKMLPTLEFIREAQGSIEYTAGTPWANLWEAVLTRTADAQHARPWMTSLGWHEHGAYVGILPLALAGVGIVAAFRRHPRVALGLLATAFFFLTIATSRGGGTVFDVLPFFENLRNPARALVMAMLALALFAGFGAAALTSRIPRERLRESLVLLGALLIFADLSTIASAAFQKTFTVEPIGFDGHGRSFYQDGGRVDIAHQVVEAGYGAKNYCPVYLRLFNPGADVRAEGEPGYRGEVYAEGTSRAELASFSPNRIVIGVHNIPPTGDRMFVNQNYERSWRSADREIRADHGRIAFDVSPMDEGKDIELRYKPRSVTIGATLSGITIVAARVAWYMEKRRRRP